MAEKKSHSRLQRKTLNPESQPKNMLQSALLGSMSKKEKEEIEQKFRNRVVQLLKNEFHVIVGENIRGCGLGTSQPTNRECICQEMIESGKKIVHPAILFDRTVDMVGIDRALQQTKSVMQEIDKEIEELKIKAEETK